MDAGGNYFYLSDIRGRTILVGCPTFLCRIILILFDHILLIRCEESRLDCPLTGLHLSHYQFHVVYYHIFRNNNIGDYMMTKNVNVTQLMAI